MKTLKQIQLKTLPFLLVELPEDAHSIKMFNHIGRLDISYFVGVETHRHYIEDHVELVGKLSDLPDAWFENGVIFESFAPRESFYSYLQAREQVYLNGNPYGDEPVYAIAKYGVSTESPDRFRKDHDRWQEAESSTFDPERTYIFEIKN